ncbi:MAG: hypothetical protein GIW95_06505 [Candidatus Eremiobacteraeota bacterium]|nr:hypothetical protein [Candidatus Eremiobacteraeota bacterium]
MPERAAAPLRRIAGCDVVRHGVLLLVAQTATNVFGFAFNFIVSRRVGVPAFGTFRSRACSPREYSCASLFRRFRIAPQTPLTLDYARLLRTSVNVTLALFFVAP